MKRFVYGNNRQFDSLYSQLSGESRKKIWFTVEFPDNTRARLGFQAIGNQILLELKACENESFPHYDGANSLFRRLVTEKSVTFENEEEMKSVFRNAKSVYVPPVQCNTQTENMQPSGERIVHVSIEIDAKLLADEIKADIIGQDLLIEGIVKCVHNHLRKKSPKKPLVIMLHGPTGVGKTETAKKLAECIQARLGEKEFPFINVKCNEFKESYRISQLTGSPQGYVGHDESCVMSVVERTGRVILLLDEFEKLHPDIVTAVMQWMDTGKVTLSRIEEGKDSADYDCQGSIFILTTNIDMKNGRESSLRFVTSNESVQSGDEKTMISADDRCRRVMVNNGFKPELAGRIARFFEFNKLTDADIAQIAVLTFKKKFMEYGFVVQSIEERLLEDIRSRYSSSQFGVRPLENALEEVLGEQLPPPSEDVKCIKVGGTIENLIIMEV